MSRRRRLRAMKERGAPLLPRPKRRKPENNGCGTCGHFLTVHAEHGCRVPFCPCRDKGGAA